MFSRSAILRDAHAQARKMRKWAGVPGTYRQIFADCLRLAWRAAKAAAAEAAWEAALPPIPAAIEAEAAAMRADAWFEPITTMGTARMVAILSAADTLETGARRSFAFHA